MIFLTAMKLQFFLNISRQPRDAPHASLYESGAPGPLISPTFHRPAVQIAVHSPYFLPSPYLDGTSFLGGRNYQLRISLVKMYCLSSVTVIYTSFKLFCYLSSPQNFVICISLKNYVIISFINFIKIIINTCM